MHCIFDKCKASGKSNINLSFVTLVPVSVLLDLYGGIILKIFICSYGVEVWAHEFWSTCVWRIWWNLDCVQCIRESFSHQTIRRTFQRCDRFDKLSLSIWSIFNAAWHIRSCELRKYHLSNALFLIGGLGLIIILVCIFPIGAQISQISEK